MTDDNELLNLQAGLRQTRKKKKPLAKHGDGGLKGLLDEIRVKK